MLTVSGSLLAIACGADEEASNGSTAGTTGRSGGGHGGHTAGAAGSVGGSFDAAGTSGSAGMGNGAAAGSAESAGGGGGGSDAGAGGGAGDSAAGTGGNAGSAGTGTGAGMGGGAPTLPALTVTLGTTRTHENASFTRTSYDYAPSVMLDGSYRMWWCGGIAGDHILYAEADSLDGPWHKHGSATPNSYDDVFQPTGQNDFDGAHTCDPSVVRVDGTYYLFYGGLGLASDPNATTRIGVASSPDGRSFTRLNGGKPIISPVRDPAAFVNKYGAGQPSVIHKGGKFYLIFTDSTGYGINPGNGAGQFVLRSADPTFQTGVEELSENGYVAYKPEDHTKHSILESFSVDWQYIDAISAFAIASHTGGGETRVYLFDDDGKKLLADPVAIPGPWHEGPGIASRPDKHAIPGSDCHLVPFDVMRAVGGEDVNSWNLGHTGADLVLNRSCADVPVPAVYEGSLIAATGTPLTMVVSGERLQFALQPPAARLARNYFAVSPAVFDAIPFGASLQSGATVIGAPGRPAAFQLDNDRLWPVSCLELITDNGSNIASVDVAAFDAHPSGHSLYCLK
jgi:predicted GH43/DUF377 family glycosyl hydrolase